VKVFVSGATGFIGGHLTRSLQAEGHEVRTVARPSTRADEAESRGVEVTRGDLRDPALVRRAMEGCDLVHHLATVRTGTSVDRLAHDPRTRAGYEADVDATRVVVECALECGVGHLVYTSSAGVHGRIRRVPADESEPLAPDTAHRKAKLDGEAMVQRAAEGQGLSSAIARPSSVYGPGDERAGRFFRMISEGRFRLLGSGEIPYHYTYVDDVVLGLRLCEGWRGEPGRPFLIGADPIPTLREFFEAIADGAGVPLQQSPVPLFVFRAAARLSRLALVPLGIRPAVIRNVEFFTLPRAYDVSRAREELGYRSQVGLREGVARTFAWMREAPVALPAGPGVREVH
jgi:nucleoside-diphosphate-sugar epimerase